jgi:DNA polymerase III subunit epsilon
MTEPAFVREYMRCFEDTWADSAPVRSVRFVLLDSETTGLDPRKDRIITIGAVAVEDGEIRLEDSFEALLKVATNTSAVTVHGTTREESLQGMEEPEAIEQFLAYLKDGVIVGHHIAHDVECFNVAYERHFGLRMRNRSLDTMVLTLHLERDGAFADREAIRQYTLDSLCEMFGVVPHDRHTAPGDAFLTAQVFLRLLRIATKHGRTSLSQLAQPFDPDSK